MSTNEPGPDTPDDFTPPPPPPGGGGPQYGTPPPPPPPPGQGWAPGPQQPWGASPQAPYGIDPVSGLPFSERSKLVAGLLQILIPMGIGRMYMGQVGLGIAQLAVAFITCGVGVIWPFIDGIIILAGNPKDDKGLPLRS